MTERREGKGVAICRLRFCTSPGDKVLPARTRPGRPGRVVLGVRRGSLIADCHRRHRCGVSLVPSADHLAYALCSIQGVAVPSVILASWIRTGLKPCVPRDQVCRLSSSARTGPVRYWRKALLALALNRLRPQATGSHPATSSRSAPDLQRAGSRGEDWGTFSRFKGHDAPIDNDPGNRLRRGDPGQRRVQGSRSSERACISHSGI